MSWQITLMTRCPALSKVQIHLFVTTIFHLLAFPKACHIFLLKKTMSWDVFRLTSHRYEQDKRCNDVLQYALKGTKEMMN